MIGEGFSHHSLGTPNDEFFLEAASTITTAVGREYGESHACFETCYFSVVYTHTHTHTHTHTEEYYSVIKKDKIMPFVATWMNLKQSKSDREGQTSPDITYM